MIRQDACSPSERKGPWEPVQNADLLMSKFKHGVLQARRIQEFILMIQFYDLLFCFCTAEQKTKNKKHFKL